MGEGKKAQNQATAIGTERRVNSRKAWEADELRFGSLFNIACTGEGMKTIYISASGTRWTVTAKPPFNVQEEAPCAGDGGGNKETEINVGYVCLPRACGCSTGDILQFLLNSVTMRAQEDNKTLEEKEYEVCSIWLSLGEKEMKRKKKKYDEITLEAWHGLCLQKYKNNKTPPWGKQT